MFGISLGDLIVIAIVAIIFIGPDKLPETIRAIVKFFYEFKSTIDEVKDSVGDSIREIKATTGIKDDLRSIGSEIGKIAKLPNAPGKDAANVISPDIADGLVADVRSKLAVITAETDAKPSSPPFPAAEQPGNDSQGGNP